MAYFKISLLTPNLSNSYTFNEDVISEFFPQETIYEDSLRSIDNKDNISGYYDENGEYIRNTKEEESFYKNRKAIFCYSYNEKLTKNLNAQKTLTFDLNKFITIENEWQENPFAKNIVIGSQILLEDQYGNQYFFTVSSIKYNIKEINTIYSISCQDTFSYQSTRQNDGFFIKNDSESADFIGALNIDEWIINYIIPECHIPYSYLKLNEGIYRDIQGNYWTYLYGDRLSNVETIIKYAYDNENNPEYYETIPFSCSGSNTNAALIQLAEQINFQIQVCEYKKGKNIGRYFWLEPKKNDQRLGLTYSPNSSIQSFSLSHDGKALTTVLNVEGITVEDKLITLIPEIPSFFINYFANDEVWNNNKNKYYPGMFSSLCSNKKKTGQHYTEGENLTLDEKWFYFSKEIEDTPVDDSRLDYNTLWNAEKGFYFSNGKIYIKIWDNFINDKKRTLNIPYLYKQVLTKVNDQYSIIKVNENDISTTYSSLGTKTSLLLLTKDAEENDVEAYEISNKEGEIPTLKKEVQGFFCFDLQHQIGGGKPVISNVSLYLDFYREVTEEEREFARIADQCPWLENKLINFNYFKDNKIISREEYQNILNTFQDTLRYVNGKLLSFTSAYYNALHKQIETLANIQNQLDLLGANCQSDIIDVIKEGQTPHYINSFENTYNAIFFKDQASISPQNDTLLNRNDLLGQYFNKYADAQQRFLRNIYNFKTYFNSNNSLDLKNIYEYNFTTNNALEGIEPGTEEVVSYGFSTANMKLIDASFNLYSNATFKPYVTCYKFNQVNGKYDTFELVHANNYKKFYVIDPTVSDVVQQTGSSKYIEGAQYYVPEIWVKVIKVEEDNKVNYYYIEENPSTLLKVKQSIDDDRNTIDRKWKLYSFTTEIDNQSYAIFRPLRTAEVDIQDTPITLYSNSIDDGILLEDNWSLHYSPVSSIEMFNNWLQDKNPLTDFNYHFAKGDCYTSFEDLKKIAEGNLSDYASNLLRRILNDGNVRDIKNENISEYRRYLPINEIYAYVPKYGVQAQVNGDKTEYLFRRYNESNEDQRDFYKYISATEEEKTKLKKIKSPYDYQEWQSFSYVNPNNAGSFYRRVAASAGLVAMIASSILYGNLVPLAFTTFWNAPLNPLGTDGLTNYDIWNHLHKIDGNSSAAWDAWRDEEWDSAHRYATSEDAIEKFNGYQKQIMLEYPTFSEENIYKNIWIYRDGDFIKDPKSNSFTYWDSILGQYIIDKEATERSIFWKLYGFNPSLIYNKYADVFYVKDTRLYPLHLDSIINKENIYKAILLGPEIEEDLRIFKSNISYNTSAGLNSIKDIVFKEGKDSFSSIGYYPLNSMGGNLDLSQVKWNNNSTIKLREALIGYDSVTEIFDDENKISIIRLEKDSQVSYFLFCREEKLRRLESSESYCAASLNPNYVNSGSHLYDENNKIVNYKEIQGWLTGYVVFRDLAEKLKPAEEIIDSFNPNTMYFDPDNQYVQCPTILQVINSTDTIYYYLGSQDYKIPLFKAKETNFSLPIIRTKYQIEWNGEHYSILQMRQDNIEKQLEFSIKEEDYNNTNTANTKVLIDNIYPFDVSINFTLTDTIEGTTNGTFWNKYRNRLDIPVLFENAAVIETKLEEYWQLALTASKYCEYFIPDNWQPRTDGDLNALSSLVYYVDEEGNAILRSTVLPNVKMYRNEQNETWLKKYIYSLPEENRTILEYTQDSLDADKNQKGFSKDSMKDIAKNNIAIINIFNTLNENIDNWVLTEYGYTTYYYCDDNSGMIWNKFVQTYTGKNFDKFSGIYVMEYNLLKNQYVDRPMQQYKYWKEQHDIIWNNIYSNYGYLILENAYKDSSSTNSTDLLKMAQLAFKDYSKPEAQYNLTTIDVAALQNYQGQEVRVGDGIKIDASQMYNDRDQIFDSLSQYLFITDISYTLRSSTDITLTVNAIKYQDKLIQKLVKLIK